MTTRRSIALILSPFGLLLISAGRLIIVANFNTTTALTIASSGGFVSTLLGSTIPLVPIFMPYVAILLLLFRRFLLSIMAFAFTAFITPTSISLGQAFRLARADWQRMLADITDHRTFIVVAVLVILAALWAYNRSFLEAASAVVAMLVAIALLIVIPNARLSKPLRLASSSEHQVVRQAVVRSSATAAYGFSWREILAAAGIAVVVYILLANSFGELVGRFAWVVTAAVALTATVALFPYVHYIYPAPQNRNYYVEATHALWLPTEEIELSNHSIYNGYVLTYNFLWFTVLLANTRTIVYLPAHEVVARTVCQPPMPAQPKKYPPLIPWLYNPPPKLPPCPSQDGATSLASFLSGGQSLRKISSVVHDTPWHIITITNAHRHEQLSAALRAYERARDWNAPTPAGVYFWYYAPVTS